MTDGERSSSEVPTSPVAPTVPDVPEQDGAKPDQARSSEIDKKFDEVINSDVSLRSRQQAPAQANERRSSAWRSCWAA
jgi:hypothetical protein